MMVKQEMISGPFQPIFFYCHHLEPRVILYVPREASFPFPLRYIDVTRATNTTLEVMLESRVHDYWNIEGNHFDVTRDTNTSLDVMLEKNIDDHWNVDGDRELSDTWTGSTTFTVFDEKLPDGFSWSGWRLTRKQTTSRPDTLWPEIWNDMSDAPKRKEKHKWAIEKMKLDN